MSEWVMIAPVVMLIMSMIRLYQILFEKAPPVDANGNAINVSPAQKESVGRTARSQTGPVDARIDA